METEEEDLCLLKKTSTSMETIKCANENECQGYVGGDESLTLDSFFINPCVVFMAVQE